MSYLSVLKNRIVDTVQALAKSINLTKVLQGLLPTDAQVDAETKLVEDEAQALADSLQPPIAAYIKAHAPFLPADEVAAAATHAALQLVDGAIIGAANVVKSAKAAQ